MNLLTFFGVIRRQTITVAAIFAIGLLTFFILLPILKSYTATAIVLASTSSSQNSATLDPTKDPTTGGIDATDLSALLVGGVIMSRVANDLHVIGKDAVNLPKRFKTKLTVGSGILPITFTDRNPNVAILGANAAARELARFDGDIKTSRYDRLIEDNDRQIGQMRARLAQVDAKMSALTSNDAFLTDDRGLAGINTRIIALEQQRDQIDAALQGDAASALSADQRPALSRDLAGPEIVHQDPMVDAIKEQYGKDLASENVLKAGYNDDFPGLKSATQLAKSEGASLQREIAKVTANPKQSTTYVTTLLDANRAHGTVAQDRAQLATVTGELATLRGELSGSSGAASRLASLRSERGAIEDSYHQLVQTQARTRADRAQAGSIDTVIVVDTAMNASQSLFSRPLVLGSAVLVITAWLAIAIAFLLDGNDRRLHTPESIESLYGKPVYRPVG